MNANDRVALMLGRAILRAEQLADDLAAAQTRIAELEDAAERESADLRATPKPS